MIDETVFLGLSENISGLAYSALPMGVVAEGYEQIVLLDGVGMTLFGMKYLWGYAIVKGRNKRI